MAVTNTYCGFGSAAGTSGTGTWVNNTGGAIILPWVPSGGSGMVSLYSVSGVPLSAGVVTALTATGFGLSGVPASTIFHINAICYHSLIS